MRNDLQHLACAIQAIERRAFISSHDCDRSPCLATRWPGIDEALGGGLLRGAVHEWFGAVDGGCLTAHSHSTDEFSNLKSDISNFKFQISDVHSTIRPPSPPNLQIGPQSKLPPATPEWSPPLSILIHLAWRAIDEQRSYDQASAGSAAVMVLWIEGSRSSQLFANVGHRFAAGHWPHPRALLRTPARKPIGNHFRSNLKSQISNLRSQSDISNFKTEISDQFTMDRTLLHRSVFIHPPDVASRVWAIDVALRRSAVAMVIADGSQLDMAASRRLQLAAEASDALVLLVRPPNELDCLSAATTRWLVRAAPTSTHHPRWTVELLRCKGMRPMTQPPRGWVMESNHATGIVSQLADVADRPAAPPR